MNLWLDMAELKKLPPAELNAVIECAGNGRSRADVPPEDRPEVINFLTHTFRPK